MSKLNSTTTNRKNTSKEVLKKSMFCREEMAHVLRILRFREKFPKQFPYYKQAAFIEAGIAKQVSESVFKLTKKGEKIFATMDIRPVSMTKEVYREELKKVNWNELSKK